jgi:hypothetical protein
VTSSGAKSPNSPGDTTLAAAHVRGFLEQREALRKIYFTGPLASYDKGLTKSARAEGGRPTLCAPQLLES